MTKITDTLRSMATSTIAEDRKAIERIEKKSGTEICIIIRHLEEQDISLQVYQSNLIDESRKMARTSIISAGLMFGGISCLLAILFRPNLAIAIIPVGLVTGAAAQSFAMGNRKPNLEPEIMKAIYMQGGK